MEVSKSAVSSETVRRQVYTPSRAGRGSGGG